MVTVKIENAYSDGHESQRLVEVPDPTPGDVAGDLEEWWEEHVDPETGDGHGAENDVEVYYEATIVVGPAALLGESKEWG